MIHDSGAAGGLSTTTLSVIIPTRKRLQALGDTLASVLSTDSPAEEVLVIDGDVERSARPVVDVARDSAPSTLRYLAGPPGLTRQRNLGLRHATGDVVVFLDDDVVVPPNLFSLLRANYSSDDIVGATGRVLEPAAHRMGGEGAALRRLVFRRTRPGAFTSFGYPSYLSGPAARSRQLVEYMPGCFMSARREAAERVRFDELLGGLGGYCLAEDEDFSLRTSRLGPIVYDPKMSIEHRKLGFSTYPPRTFNRIVVVNRWYLFRKNFPQSRRARAGFACLLFILLAHRLVNREWNAALGIVDGALALASRRA
jgi:glycosyltransferase involved in cell wall biosynthesis